jgi:hypothetical protein
MKKIMFNDKMCLTQAVIEGRKTQTRRIVSQSLIDKKVIELETLRLQETDIKTGDNL